jgi:hypothetical protein
MKKIYLYFTMFLVAGFSACTEDLNIDVAPPQSYPQEAQQIIDGFTIALGNDFVTPFTITDEVKELQLVKATATPVLAEGATVTFRTEISDIQDFTGKVVELPSASAGNAATTLTADLNEALKTLFGKAPKARTFYIRTYFYILDGTSASMMPTPAVLGPVTVTTYSNAIIEPAYYLIGGINGWNFENLESYKFNHSDLDVYEDPVFSITVYMASDDKYFKIVPQSGKEAADWTGLLGNPIDGNTELKSTLVLDGQAMRILENGWVKITLDMMESTYTIELLGDAKRQLYVPGDYQGWSPDTAPVVFSPNLDWKFDGYVYLEAGNAFKFTSDPDWEHTNYGDGGNGTLSTANDVGNLTVDATGFYRLTVDLSGDPYTYTATATDWGVIGDANGWVSSIPMTLNSATGEWTVTTTLVGGKEFKFRANDDWDINLGGDANNLTYGGDNILASEDGTYLITLKLGDPTAYKYTIVKQ